MARRSRSQRILRAAKSEALLAVDLHNRPYGYRYLEAHIVHMQLAWLYLSQSIFVRDGVDHYYRDQSGSIVATEDGDPKTWELKKSIAYLYPDANDPVRRNVEFFIGLRNKIEHQYSQAIETMVAGKTQSNVLNFETRLVAEFGPRNGLGQQLRLPLFLATLNQDAVVTLKKARDLLPIRVAAFITQYDDGLPESVRQHPNYDLRIYLIPKTGSKSEADAALEFVHIDQLSDADRSAIDNMQVILRDRQIQVVGKGLLKPYEVAKLVESEVPFRFPPSYHIYCWKHFEVRPEVGATNPHETDQRYCLYNEPYGDYLYTQAWVRKLVRELGSAEGFKNATGREPVTKAVRSE